LGAGGAWFAGRGGCHRLGAEAFDLIDELTDPLIGVPQLSLDAGGPILGGPPQREGDADNDQQQGEAAEDRRHRWQRASAQPFDVVHRSPRSTAWMS
jgi:hypothetical protein